ncbi:hypothetical protein BASA81_003153 [Batrachochytrium salamandrivorans]|nr:hypothetical protein BASA81_003153 [Batrachochytrium salamandrivorans]
MLSSREYLAFALLVLVESHASWTLIFQQLVLASALCVAFQQLSQHEQQQPSREVIVDMFDEMEPEAMVPQTPAKPDPMLNQSAFAIEDLDESCEINEVTELAAFAFTAMPANASPSAGEKQSVDDALDEVMSLLRGLTLNDKLLASAKKELRKTPAKTPRTIQFAVLLDEVTREVEAQEHAHTRNATRTPFRDLSNTANKPSSVFSKKSTSSNFLLTRGAANLSTPQRLPSVQ